MNKNLEKQNKWVAGVTDGDGCFYINKKEKNVSIEFTMHIKDLRLVQGIKNQKKGGFRN